MIERSEGIRLFARKVIGGDANPLLIRWILVRVPFLGIYLHKLCRSDHERALHDHPWSFVSVVLRGGYHEITASGKRWRGVGSIAYRPATWRHRVVIAPARPAWTLVFVGPRSRNWGFWPGDRFCFWRRYNPELGICEDES